MLDLFDQDRSSYVVFGYLQNNASEGRARVRICDSANDLASLLHHYGRGTHVNNYTHTLLLFLLTMLIWNARTSTEIASGLAYALDRLAPPNSFAAACVHEAPCGGSD